MKISPTQGQYQSDDLPIYIYTSELQTYIIIHWHILYLPNAVDTYLTSVQVY